MAESVRSTVRGLLLADPRFSDTNIDTSRTTATQTGASPDTAVRRGTGRARLDAVDLQTGSVVAAERWMQVQKAGGHSLPSAARLTWSETDGGTERSWMGPSQCLDFFWLAFESGLTTYANPALLGLADGSVLIVYLKLVSGTATGINIADALPASTTFVPGSLRSGTSCASATTVEDDNANGADESDPFGASITGTTVAATTPTLLPTNAMAVAFDVTIN